MAVFVDGVPGPFHDDIETPVFNDGRDRWGYIGSGADGFSVVLDDQLIARESHASNLVIAPDGHAYAYIAKRGDDAFVVDEAGCANFDVLVEGSLIFCDDGMTWACLAGDSERESLYVAVEDVFERRAFDWEQIVRLTRQSEIRGGGPEDSSELIRAWVAAAAELLLERQRNAGFRGRENRE
jgi:hypothetical protein